MSRRSVLSWARLRRGIRGLWPDHNPLRRTCDRVEAGICAALLALFVIGSPLAGLFAAHWAYSESLRIQRIELARWHQVPAVLLTDATNMEYAATAQAKWTIPCGPTHRGRILVPTGSKAGSSVMVWVDPSGQVTGPPMGPSETVGSVVLVTAIAITALGLLLLCAGLIAHLVLNRRRLSGWDADWWATGPQWSPRPRS